MVRIISILQNGWAFCSGLHREWAEQSYIWLIHASSHSCSSLTWNRQPNRSTFGTWHLFVLQAPMTGSFAFPMYLKSSFLHEAVSTQGYRAGYFLWSGFDLSQWRWLRGEGSRTRLQENWKWRLSNLSSACLLLTHLCFLCLSVLCSEGLSDGWFLSWATSSTEEAQTGKAEQRFWRNSGWLHC